MEQDQEIRKLFDGFEPTLSDPDEFIKHIEADLKAIDRVKSYNILINRRNRRSVVVASIVGFAVGALFAIFYPSVLEAISHIDLDSNIAVADYAESIIGWLIIAGISLISAIATYDLSRVSIGAGAEDVGADAHEG